MGKKWGLLFFIILLMPAVQAQDEMLRVMSFNIRFANPGDGEHAWKHRKNFVADVIQYNQAGIIGMQEALVSQVHELDSMLADHAWVGVGRDDGKEKGEFNPVFYDKNRFELLESNTFWLSKTPSKPGAMGWDAACARIVTWARLKVKTTGKKFYFFNTHFDHQGTIARLKSAELVIDSVSSKVADEPVFLTGDLNSLKRSGPYQHLTHWNNAAGLRDAREVSDEGPYGPNTTYIGFEADFSKQMIIDYILANKRVGVHRHVIVDDRKGDIYPSDHLPVVAEVYFKK